MRKKYFKLPVLALALSACNSPASFDRGQMLTMTAQDFVVPAYQDVMDESEALQASVTAFCASPSASTLVNAQAAWKVAQTSVKRIEVVGFGPYLDDHLNDAMDFWPTRPSNIEKAIDDHPDATAATIEGLGSVVQGLPAMEYLLFDGTPSAILTKFAASTDGDRCDFLKAQSERLSANAEALYDAWADPVFGFYSDLSRAGDGNLPYPTVQSAVNEFVNQMGFLVEVVKDTKIGKPFGKKSGGTTLPDSVESPYSENSLNDIVDSLEGLKRFYQGSFIAGTSGSLSVYALLKTKDAYIADVIVNYIDESVQAVRDIPEPLSTSVNTYPERVETAYQRLVLLKAVIAGQMSGLLGVTPYFSDNDGD